ncbi:MAG: LamG-like jellyroll fold domain-containing protein [Rickettsiales bacterium]|nr:LamG-like jellyroll fold domain-containing protein [Rickettsiales bacterium]
MKKNYSAFSLIELAIVILIIGILIAGVISGSGVVKSARINSARSFTAKSVVPTINGLTAWYEASLDDSFIKSEAYNSGQISTWYDISPSSRIAKRNSLTRSASAQVLYQISGINKIPSVSFISGANASFNLSSFYQGSLTQSTIFIVFRPTNSVTLATISDSNSTSSTSIALNSNNITLNAGISASTSTASNPANISLNNNYIMAVYFSGSSSKAYLNNATTSAGNSTIDAGTNSLNGLTIGSQYNSTNPYNGLISEIIIYNRALQIQERRDVFKYLSYKYKISVTGI